MGGIFKTLLLLVLLPTSLLASESFVFSMSEKSLSIDPQFIINGYPFYTGEHNSLEQKIDYLSKIPSEPFDVKAILDQKKYSSLSEDFKNDIQQNFSEILEPYILSLLKNYEVKAVTTDNSKGFQVKKGREFVIDLLTKGNKKQKIAANIFINKYYRLPFKEQALVELYNIIKLSFNQTFLMQKKDYTALELEKFKSLAKSLKLNVRTVGESLLIGSGISFNTLVDVLNQQKHLKNEKLIQVVSKINRVAKNKNVVFASEYLDGARAYFSNSRESLVSFVIPELADLDLYVHEVTHYRFYKFIANYKKWIKAKKDWVVPAQVMEEAEFSEYWSLLNEINSWRLGTSFSAPLTDQEILDKLKQSYAQKNDFRYYQAFFQYWTVDRLKDKSIPALILHETKQLNSMTDQQLLEYGQQALQSNSEIAQRNYLKLLKTKGIAKDYQSEHEHLINLYLNKRIFELPNSLMSLKRLEIKINSMNYNSRANNDLRQTNSYQQQQLQEIVKSYFEKSPKAIQNLMTDIFNDKYRNLDEILNEAQYKYKVQDLSNLKEFLSFLDSSQPISKQLKDHLKSLFDKSYEEFYRYYLVSQKSEYLLTYFSRNKIENLSELHILEALSVLIQSNFHGVKRSFLLSNLIRALRNNGLKDLLLNAENLNDIESYQNNIENNKAYFSSAFNRYVSFKLFELNTRNQIAVLVDFIKTFTTPEVLPKLKLFIFSEIDLFENHKEAPAWLSMFMNPIPEFINDKEGVNISWSQEIVDYVLQNKNRIHNPEMYLLVTNFYKYQLNELFKQNNLKLYPQSYKYGAYDRMNVQQNLNSSNELFHYWLQRVEMDLWPLLTYKNKMVRRAALYSIASNPAYLMMLEDKIHSTLNDPNADSLLLAQVRELLDFTQKGFFKKHLPTVRSLISPAAAELQVSSCKRLF